MFSSRLVPIRLLWGPVRSIGEESLTFKSNFSIKIETSLIIVIIHKNYVLQLSAFENYIFSPIERY